MEWAILISKLRHLRYADDPWNDQGRFDSPPRVAAVRQTLRQIFPAARFNRMYFGCEFCEYRLPPLPDVERTFHEARSRNWGFSFIAPYATEDAVKKSREILDFLAAHEPQANGHGATEVIVNDWGFLRLLEREYPALTPVAGRMINKMLRDPRVTGRLEPSRTPQSQLAARSLQAIRESTMTSDLFRQFLSGFGVRRFEMENLIQGLDMDFASMGVEASLYLPFGFVATGRVCMMAGIHLPPGEKFTPGAPCAFECQVYTVDMKNTNRLFPDTTLYTLKGNTVFYIQEERHLRQALEDAERCKVSRIVYQPELPL